MQSNHGRRRSTLSKGDVCCPLRRIERGLQRPNGKGVALRLCGGRRLSDRYEHQHGGRHDPGPGWGQWGRRVQWEPLTFFGNVRAHFRL
jgi:hypothetical protein